MRFKGLDLNLVAAFDVLLETHSVSRAAEAMGLSQPAMSAALGRLRDYFGDPILVADGKQMHPTAYAESLVPHVRECLRAVETMISTSTTFDPAASQRTFRLICSDYVIAAVIVPLVARLVEIAPLVRIEIILPTDQSIEQIAQGKADLYIAPEDFVSRDLPSELLFEERHVVVGWAGNPLFKGQLTEEDILSAGHVGIAMGNQRLAAFGDKHLALMGKSRRIEVTTSSFTTIPWLLKDTLRLGMMHERLARSMAEFFPLAWAPLPFEFPTMRQMMQFNSARAEDSGLKWLRLQIRAVAGA